MDCQNHTTLQAQRKRGQHLQREERGAIQHLKHLGYSNRAIAREIGCSPTTIGNELRRGTPPRRSSKGRTPFELPEILKRKRYTGKNRQNKRILGTSIELRPEIAAQRVEEGHWEGDTVVGLRSNGTMVCSGSMFPKASPSRRSLMKKSLALPTN